MLLEDGTSDLEKNFDSSPSASKVIVKESIGDKGKRSQNCTTPAFKMSAEKVEDLTRTSETCEVQARGASGVNKNCENTAGDLSSRYSRPFQVTPLSLSAVTKKREKCGDPESENVPECEDKGENFSWKPSDIKNQET